MWLYGCVQSHSFYSKKDQNNNGDGGKGYNNNGNGKGDDSGSGSIVVPFGDSKIRRAYM